MLYSVFSRNSELSLLQVMRRRRAGGHFAAATAAFEQVEQLGEAGQAAADAVFLHQHRDGLALLVEPGQLLAQAKVAFVGARGVALVAAVQLRGLGPVELQAKAQLVGAGRVERQAVRHVTAWPGQAATHDQRVGCVVDPIDTLGKALRQQAVIDAVGAVGRAELADVGLSLRGAQEGAAGHAGPQAARRLGRVADA